MYLYDTQMHSLHNNSIPGSRLKGRVQVEFISEEGLAEAGIDGGGLFKEFLDAFAKTICDPLQGVFIATSEQTMTPNPLSGLLVGSGHLEVFKFAGKMLGKALYEKVLFQSELAHGFLNILLGRLNELDDLYRLDATVYSSIMKLKKMAKEGQDVRALDLYFAVQYEDINGCMRSHELVPNGSTLSVDNNNVRRYIHYLAHYKQNVVIRDQCRAFLTGFHSLIPLDWLRMFNTLELQLLISGDNRHKIDLQDMMLHTNYSSGYHPSQPYIQAFWQIVSDFSMEDQANLLKFVTSVPRQPLLGFAVLNPAFCIQQVPAYSDIPLGSDRQPEVGQEARLPTAATCMNLLKLPLYPSIEMLKEKLLYAIRSNSGFELS